MKKVMSIILLLVGATIFLFGSYMAREIAAQGQMMEEASGHQRRVPLVGPVRKGEAMQSNEQTQKRKGAIQMWMMSSQANVSWMHGVGAIVFIAGAAWLVLLSIPHNHSRKR